MKLIKDGMINIFKNHLIDFSVILGILFISIGSFLTSIVTGFFVTGIMLILFAISLFILGGD